MNLSLHLLLWHSAIMGLVIIVTNTKGGPGKTTTTVNLAFVARARGYSVAIIDADRQQHARLWADVCHSEIETLDFTAVELPEVKSLVEATAEEHDVVFVDTPGHTEAPGLVQALTLCSRLAIVPLEPSALDAKELPQAFQYIEVSRQVQGTPEPFIVFSKTRKNAAAAREFLEEANEAGFHVAQSRIQRLDVILDAALKSDLTLQRGRVPKKAAKLYENLFDELIAPHLPEPNRYVDSHSSLEHLEQRRVANE